MAKKNATTKKPAERAAQPKEIKPAVGKFYRTKNGSIVYVLRKIATFLDALVVSGGHGDSSRRGTRPGETYSVTRLGAFANDEGNANLAGMDLAAEVTATFT